jgi:hypothetical protein
MNNYEAECVKLYCEIKGILAEIAQSTALQQEADKDCQQMELELAPGKDC